jgi:hypothetical protein
MLGWIFSTLRYRLDAEEKEWQPILCNGYNLWLKEAFEDQKVTSNLNFGHFCDEY